MERMIIKAFSSRLAVALLATATGLVTQASVASQDLLRQNLPSLQAQVNQNKEILTVSLPTEAEILLKGGKTIDGQIIGIDNQGQKLSIQQGGRDKQSIPLSQVEKVKFNGSVVYKADGRKYLRGDGGNISPAGGQVSLPEIPLNAFSFRGDPNKGQADVILGAGGLSRGIRDTAKTRQFVVDEMQFNLPKKTMKILATPY